MFARTLTRPQRDVLWREAQYEIERETAGMGRAELLVEIERMQDAIRFYDDIGWEEEGDWRDSYVLTMPDDQLARIVGRLREAAVDVLHDAVAGPFGCPGGDYVDRNLEFLHVCTTIAGEA